MKIPHDKFCVLPWISLEASPAGTVRPCCLAEEEIVNNLGRKFELVDCCFDDIQTSDYMNNLRQQFLDGKQPATCKKCWQEEAAGRTSKRMHTLDRLKHVDIDQEWTTEPKQLKFLDLKLGNICNLKCRICGSWSSSTFAAEELKFIKDETKIKNSYHYEMMRKGAWPRINSQFWEEIERAADGIEYIEFTGGEPFMIEQHFDLLESLVARGLAAGIEIHYNTNGTHYPEHAVNIWKHFKTVEIAFSIDDVGKRFEYQRSGAEWDQVQQNIKKFQDLRQHYTNIRLQVCATINVFNILYLEELSQWIDRQNFNFVYWNMLHQAEYLSISTMPAKVKQEAAARLANASVAEKTKQEFRNAIQFMMNQSNGDGILLEEKIRELDHRRGQDLGDFLPELAQLLDYKKK